MRVMILTRISKSQYDSRVLAHVGTRSNAHAKERKGFFSRPRLLFWVQLRPIRNVTFTSLSAKFFF